ncbi:hypothetical protein H5410_042093 [Solanum commersonii]|uniref:Uncharacterized protein n=1 Tax=Solanum commersonii TaxID=4109 RepID=A0A9J5XTD4_SOLCO|nr:hypothetical protein H5410_042093 [Solanum commersonii]
MVSGLESPRCSRLVEAIRMLSQVGPIMFRRGDNESEVVDLQDRELLRMNPPSFTRFSVTRIRRTVEELKGYLI